MIIGLISDTHIPEAGPLLPTEIYDSFKGVDLILHAGDIHVLEVLDWLEHIAPVVSARGNGDYPTRNNNNRPGIPEDPRVKHSQIIRLEGFNVGLIHAFPLPSEVFWKTADELVAMHFDDHVDIIVCGDTHEARIDLYPKLLIANPGSPTLPNQTKGLGTIGFLDISSGNAYPSLLQLTY